MNPADGDHRAGAGKPALARRRSRIGTVRFRVTAVASLATLSVLMIAGWGLLMAQQRFLTGNLDGTLRQRADDLTAVVDGAVESGSILAGEGEDEAFAQIVRGHGGVVAATPNLVGRRPVAGGPEVGSRETVRRLDDLVVDDDEAAAREADEAAEDAGEGEAFRVLSRRVGTGGDAAVIHVGAALDDVDESVELLGRLLVAGVPVLTIVLAMLIWILVGRTLRPVEAIRAEVAAIGASRLDRRVPQPGGDDEVARLARTMNEMLERIDTSVRRQQQFVGDASHELRSPLTRIRSEIEVDLAYPERADLTATQASVLEEVIGLQRLVDDLLTLAHQDAGAVPMPDHVVDLDDVVLDEADRVRMSRGDVAIDVSGVSAAQVRGDRIQLSRAVRNLAENAGRYATGLVIVTLAEHDGRAVLTVADDGPGVAPGDRARVFERFGRSDEARSAASGGTGLGLAITREIVERHGGTIGIDSGWQPGVKFVLALPLATDGSEDPRSPRYPDREQ